MALADLLQISQDRQFGRAKIDEQVIRHYLQPLRQRISFYREYPDLFVDTIKGQGCNFQFYFYQRVFIRIVMRHRYVYGTFPRAFGKSFIAMMVLMLRCILFPGSKMFVTTGGKQQAASITMSKVDQICSLIPALSNQIDWTRGKTKKGKDDVTYAFKSGSTMDILAARETSRGQRRTGGLIEQVILVDQQALNSIIIPTTNVNRRLPDGSRDPKEIVNKSQIYITTAGWKNSFAYQKLIQLLIQSVIDPDQVMVIGGTYITPVAEGLLDEDFIDQLKMSGTYNQDSFDREYRSKWSGDAQDAFFSSQIFDKHRVLLQAQDKYSGRTSRDGYYILGVDVGRLGCNTQVVVFKVTPQPVGSAIKSVVNLFAFQAEHFENQAIHIKKLFYRYKVRTVAIDANGLGAGLMDFMVKSQIDPQTNQELPPFGVLNDPDGVYKSFKTDNMEKDAIFQIKANAPLNTQAYTYVQTQLSSGKVKFLIDQNQAKAKYLATKMGQAASVNKRNKHLRPYVMTTVLRQQMLNLVQKNEGFNIILSQSSRGIPKDKFSAFTYGMYYIKQIQDTKKRRKKRDLSQMMFMS